MPAMKLYRGSAAQLAHRRSDSRAEQPAYYCAGTNETASATPEQHAQQCASELQRYRSTELKECIEWLESLPTGVVAQSQPLQRVFSVKAVLQMPSTRAQRHEIQVILKAWDVPQKYHGRKRKVNDVKEDLVARVIEETKRLKTMHKIARAPNPSSAASLAWAQYSAIQATLAQDT